MFPEEFDRPPLPFPLSPLLLTRLLLPLPCCYPSLISPLLLLTPLVILSQKNDKLFPEEFDGGAGGDDEENEGDDDEALPLPMAGGNR